MATQLEPTQFKTRSPNSSRIHSLTGVRMAAVAAFAPDDIVRNVDLAALGYDEEWIVQRTGIHERRKASAELAASDVAHEAAKRCLDKAGVDASEIDLILFATMTPDTIMPSAACHLQRRLGSRAPAMDLNAACSGFIFALATGAQFVKTGFSHRALVVGVDLMSRTVNPADKKTFPLFGDGGGAVLLGPGVESEGLLAYTLGSDGEGAELLCIPAGGTREPISQKTLTEKRNCIHMDGKPVFKWAVRMVSDAIRNVVQAARLSIADIDHFVLHQANRRIIDAVAHDLGIEPEHMVVNVERYGNTSAGSIPLALAEVDEQGNLRRGDRLVLCGFGAGLTWGAAVVQY
jgi:3-oxoacyl-[acyl-carrier-protein] synthase-3